MTLIPDCATYLPEMIDHDGVVIERFTVSKDDIMALFRLRHLRPGTYTRLKIDGHLWMSDTPAEKIDHFHAVRASRGDCLVTGLGLGMVANAMALREEVQSVTVIERERRIVEAVAPHLHPKITVIEADALTWSPPKGQRYGVVWHDIWQSICADNLPEMTKLKRRFGRRADWQGCWAEHLCRRAA